MSDARLARRLTCLTVHKIQQFHLSDIPLVWQTKSPTQIFPDNPQIESFHFICQTFLLSLWSCKQDVLCFGWFQTSWKESKYGDFSGLYFPVFWLNTGNTDQKKLLICTVFAKWSVGFFRKDFVTEDFFWIFLRHLLIYLFIYFF